MLLQCKLLHLFAVFLTHFGFDSFFLFTVMGDSELDQLSPLCDSFAGLLSVEDDQQVTFSKIVEEMCGVCFLNVTSLPFHFTGFACISEHGTLRAIIGDEEEDAKTITIAVGICRHSLVVECRRRSVDSGSS
jgi:hypothetical protein